MSSSKIAIPITEVRGRIAAGWSTKSLIIRNAHLFLMDKMNVFHRMRNFYDRVVRWCASEAAVLDVRYNEPDLFRKVGMAIDRGEIAEQDLGKRLYRDFVKEWQSSGYKRRPAD